MAVVIKRFDVFLVNLDPTVGSEIKKLRPCAIVSPDEMNRNIETVIIAPMMTRGQNYPTRIACHFEGKDGQIALDQLRTVDKMRLSKKLGHLSESEQMAVLKGLAALFSE